jgi:two-component system response regulator RegA
MSDRALMLIVEDDEALRVRLARAFESRGFDVRVAATAQEAAQIAADDAPEFVVLDLRIGDRNGLDLIPALKRGDAETRIVVLTGYGSVATAIEALRRGATHYLTKPADADEILAAFSGQSRAGGDDTPPIRTDVARSRRVGSTSIVCSWTAAATSPKPPECSACIGDRCRESWRSFRREDRPASGFGLRTSGFRLRASVVPDVHAGRKPDVGSPKPEARYWCIAAAAPLTVVANARIRPASTGVAFAASRSSSAGNFRDVVER